MGIGQNINMIGRIGQVTLYQLRNLERIDPQTTVVQNPQFKGPEVGIIESISNPPQRYMNPCIGIRFINRIRSLKIKTQAHLSPIGATVKRKPHVRGVAITLIIHIQTLSIQGVYGIRCGTDNFHAVRGAVLVRGKSHVSDRWLITDDVIVKRQIYQHLSGNGGKRAQDKSSTKKSFNESHSW